MLPWDREIPAVLGRRAPDVPIDAYERAGSSDRRIVRLTPSLIRSRVDAPTADELVGRLQQALHQLREPDDDEAHAENALRALATEARLCNGAKAEELADADVVPHPADREGVVLIGRVLGTPAPVDPFGGEDYASFAARAVPLTEHAAQVATQAEAFASRCLPRDMVELFRLVGLHHDDGKVDPRFQGLLRGDGIPLPPAEGRLLAKSPRPAAPVIQQRLRERLGLPDGFRHEMLSLQFAAKGDNVDDLLLHLIAAHHGYARPFAPVVADGDPPDVAIGGASVTAGERRECPAHALGSGVAERFWRLTRRYGWWGLAYLEAILRLADHHASRFPNLPKEARNG